MRTSGRKDSPTHGESSSTYYIFRGVSKGQRATGPILTQTRSRDQSWGMEEGILKVSEDLPMVVMTVAAKIIALGQFQLLKVWFPVMATPCPAASDTI